MAPVRQQAGRLPVLGVVGATVLAGLLFGPTFGSNLPPAVVVPVLVVGAVVYLSFEAAKAFGRFEPWRPVVTTLLGILAVVETTLHDTTAAGFPTAQSIRALIDGARRSWLETLQSTLPARPDADLVVFVPLLVLVALLIAVQIVLRTRARLAALLPGLLVAGLAQAFHPIATGPAVLVAAGFALAAAAVLGSVPRVRVRTVLLAVAATTPIVLIGTLAAAATDPSDRSAYSLQDTVAPPTKPLSVTSPLDEIAFRLRNPSVAQFEVRGPRDTELWPVTVLDRYDGVTFRSSAEFRTLGSRLTGTPQPGVRTNLHRADVRVTGLPGPYLPSQDGLDDVRGVRPLIDVRTGEMLDRTLRDGTDYRVAWRSPDLAAASLADAALTPHASPGTASMGQIPDGIVALAREIAGNREPTFATALAIERFLRTNYRQAVGKNLPTGHTLAKIAQFLGVATKPVAGKPRGIGTSEQFASAYVVLARIVGVPARLAVGYRQPSRAENGVYVVRNADVLAWPEVAVRGVGWVPLDPIGASNRAKAANGNSVARATDKARDALPPKTSGDRDAGRPRTAAVVPPKDDDTHIDLLPWLVGAGILLAVLLLIRVIGVPLVKWSRTRLRRRRSGNAAIVSAWLEARDRLRDHGVAITSDMTVRDAGQESGRMLGASTGHAMERLSNLVDLALWSGSLINRYPPDVAWQASDEVRRTLAERPLRQRLMAGVRLRGLRPLS